MKLDYTVVWTEEAEQQLLEKARFILYDSQSREVSFRFHREIRELAGHGHLGNRLVMLDGLTDRPRAAAGQRLFLRGFRSQHSCLVVSRSFSLLKGNGVLRTGRQTIAQAVAVVLVEQLGFAVYHTDGPFVTGAGAEAAAAAFFFVDGDNSSDHVRSPYNLFVENLRELYEKMSLQIFAVSLGSEMIIREKKNL